MAELGAVASLIGIIGAGAKLSLLLFDFGSSIGSAGSQVRSIGTEISLFCAVLKQLERTLAKAKDRRYSISAIETTHEILEQCQVVFNELQTIFDSLKKSKLSSGETSMDLLGRLKWVMKRDQVRMHRATLESCKITLHIMLTTLEFADRVSARRISTSETELEDEQEEIMTRSLVIAQKCAIDRLEKLENENGNQDNPVDDILEYPNRSCTSLAEAQPSRLEDYVIKPAKPSVVDGSIVRPASTLSARKNRRTSVWLHDLIPETNVTLDSRSQSRGGVSTSPPEVRPLSLLLWKWTDQGERWDQMHKSRDAGLDTQAQLDVRPKDEPLGYLEDLPQTLPAIRYTSGSQNNLKWPSSPRFRVNRPSALFSSKDAALPSPPITPRSPRRPQAFTRVAAKDKEMPATPPDTPKPLPSPKSPTFLTVAGEVIKKIHIHGEDSCEQVLPIALKKHSITDDWRKYALVIAFDDQERTVRLDEKPLALHSRLCREGKKATFMLRKLTVLHVESSSVPGGLL